MTEVIAEVEPLLNQESVVKKAATLVMPLIYYGIAYAQYLTTSSHTPIRQKKTKKKLTP